MKTICVASPSPASGLAPARRAAPSEPLAVLAARAACALEQSVERFVRASDQNLGHLEVQAAQDIQALLGHATERAAQAKADATPPV